MIYGTKLRGHFPMGEYKEGMTGKEMIRAGFDKFEHWDKPMICQEKLDGWFGIVCRGDDKCYWDAEWGKYSKLQAMLPEFEKFMPTYSIIIGEVGYGTEKETALAERNGFNRFVIYDCLAWKGEVLKNQPHIERFNFIRKVWENSKYFEEINPKIQFVKSRLLTGGPEENKLSAWQMFDNVLYEGGEGIVLKEFDGHYIVKGDTSSMYKIKKFITKDYVCMGFTRSVAPTYLDQGMTVASMECGLLVNGKLVAVTQTAGFDFEWRKKFSDHPEKYIGKVVELGGFEVFPSGAMRHSSFLRFREDRSIQDCVL